MQYCLLEVISFVYIHVFFQEPFSFLCLNFALSAPRPFRRPHFSEPRRSAIVWFSNGAAAFPRFFSTFFVLNLPRSCDIIQPAEPSGLGRQVMRKQTFIHKGIDDAL